MDEYLDAEGNKIEMTIYIGCSGNVFYFTGKYDSRNMPLFENIRGGTTDFNAETIKNFHKLTKKEVKKRINELKSNANWLEEKLKE
ncbi:MAG: hypothetical protein NT066_03105 [Candidatus Omnitrophica bacterium]|nr:hypothetical protein [Candidatus Omnitrophota bacterium]